MARDRLQPGEYGEISVRQISKGKWEAKARWCDPRTGKTTPVTKRGPKKAAAKTALKAKLGGGDRGKGASGRIGGGDPVEKLAQLWLRRKIAERKAGPQSISKYESAMRLHVIPRLGAAEVRSLEIGMVDELLLDLIETVPSQAKRARVVLAGMVRLAVAHGALGVNFMHETITVPIRRQEIRTLTLSEISRMLIAVDEYRTGPGRRGPAPDARLGNVLRVMLGGGLRIGEALAVRRCDVTPPTGAGSPWLVAVCGTIVTPDRGPTFRQPLPKNANSERKVPVAGFAGAVLEKLLADTVDSGPQGLLFQTRNGTPVAPGNVRRTWLAVRSQTMLADLSDITPHALRRTVATLLTAELSPEYAAKYLGHGQGTATLFAHYVKYINEVDDLGGGVLDGLMPRSLAASPVNQSGE